MSNTPSWTDLKLLCESSLIPSSLFLLPSPRKKKKKSDPRWRSGEIWVQPLNIPSPVSISVFSQLCGVRMRPSLRVRQEQNCSFIKCFFFFFYFKPLWRFLISELNMFLSSVVSEIFYLSLVSVAYSFFFFPRLFKYTSYLLRKFWSPTLFPHLLIGRL